MSASDRIVLDVAADRPHWWRSLFAGDYDAPHWYERRALGAAPALLVIDVVRAFVGEEGHSLAESVAEWPTSCGPTAWESLPAIAAAVRLAGAREWPVIYTTGLPGGAALYGGTVKAEMTTMASPMDRPGAQDIPDQVKPPPDAVVLAKPKASAFFQTPLAALLTRRRVDSVVVTGCTTSGCVRASVIDAHSAGFATFVLEEAVFDRSLLSHGVNLFEMNAKYADVVSLAELGER